MTIYNYDIIYLDGHTDRFENLTERIDMEVITQKEWWLLDCVNWRQLIRTSQIATVHEEVEELNESDSLYFALKRTNWSKSKTMEMLGIGDRMLYRRMREKNLNWGALKP